MKNADRYWQDRYFLMLVNDKSMGGLANAFYPLWGLLRKELRKPPPKALLFEEKLERLLAQPNREWDEICVTSRLKSSSLWMDFVKIETELALDMLNIEFPSPKELLVRKKAQKEAAKAAAKAVVATATSRASKPPLLPLIESSLEPSNVPAQPLTKKRKVDEKSKKKVPAKRKKAVKATTSETEVEFRLSKQEEANIEVKLPLGRSLLQIKELSVGIMHQLLSDVDTDTINEGRIQNHLNEFICDGLKSTLRAMGLVYRTTKKAVEWRERIKELEDIDKERGERLLDIERRFRDVKASADGLISELQTLNQTAKEGADMMKIMASRFDEVKAKIETREESVKQKEVDNVVLVARIIDEYERATLKARYELLKEYKQGLLVDAEVDEEIELFEESAAEVGDPLSAPITSIEQVGTVSPAAANDLTPLAVEPPTSKDPKDDPPTSEKTAKH
ncbi:hypothetical protein TIFTF001_027600 [Ficus carica]|uniref:Uncharacterized protein n=1 Tax=Ficus carica TaxID=3494 RepID=A0AA88DNA5_FICCA|nr:hypothetical protein TIFTF001_027600 [Ficus carica]